MKRHRPGQADDIFTLPAVKESVEDADQLRVALLRGKEVSGMALDGTDLEQYRMTTTPLAEERRVRSEPAVEPVGDERLHHEAAGERVEREQPGEPQHGRARAVQPQVGVQERGARQRDRLNFLESS